MPFSWMMLDFIHITYTYVNVQEISSTEFDFHEICNAGQEVDFVAEFVILGQNHHFYEVNFQFELAKSRKRNICILCHNF